MTTQNCGLFLSVCSLFLCELIAQPANPKLDLTGEHGRREKDCGDTGAEERFRLPGAIKLLRGAFNVDSDAVAGKRILLVDDLYRSGAAATAVAQDLLSGPSVATQRT